MRTRRALCGVALIAMLFALPAWAQCPTAITTFLSGKTAGTLTCFSTSDLRTTVPPTSPVAPADNSITMFANGTSFPGLLAGYGSFTPRTDLGVISNGPAVVPTSSNGPVSGVEVYGWFADDPSGEARFLLRLPDNWNGKLVVAGASGTRSEFNGDWAWSDYVLQKGYAYASQNKGVLNLYLQSLTDPFFGNATDPLACRGNPTSSLWVHFYDNDPGKPFTQWTQYMIETAQLAQGVIAEYYKHAPTKTYAVGTSNGGYQVRRAMEVAPKVFDGGVDWEGTFINPFENILSSLPPAIKNFPAYVASGYDPKSQAAKNIVNAGYPPDIVYRDATTGAVTGSLWSNYSDHFWEVTMCQWQKRFDPSYVTYGTLTAQNSTGNLPNYNYFKRIFSTDVALDLVPVTTTGMIKRPLITVAGTMDALLPIKRQARAYEEDVNFSNIFDRDHPPYRLYEVQNGNHIEAYVCTAAPCVTTATATPNFPQLQLIQPHAQKAFDLLVDYVEGGTTLPPSQCIPKGGQISNHPTKGEEGHCKSLFVP